jgi:hypothetical protein
MFDYQNKVKNSSPTSRPVDRFRTRRTLDRPALAAPDSSPIRSYPAVLILAKVSGVDCDPIPSSLDARLCFDVMPLLHLAYNQ